MQVQEPVRKQLSERQFTAIARSQDALRDAENAAVAAQKAAARAQQEAKEIFALICEAQAVPESVNVQLDIEHRQLVFSLPSAPPAADPLDTQPTT